MNISKLLLSAALMLCCTFSALAQLGTPPDDEIWYTADDDLRYDLTLLELWEDYEEVFGADIVSSSFEYNYSSGIGTGVIKFDGPVTKVGDYAFSETDLTSMSLPNTVKSIGERAFYWMDEMTEISLGNSVQTIWHEAFSECDGLESIDIPASVTEIGNKAFYNCNELKAVSLGNSVQAIGNYAFAYCYELKAVSFLGNSVSIIGNEAFYDCEKLETIAIPASVIEMGEYAFAKCYDLKFAAIGCGLTNIPQYAFYDCNELRSVAIDGNGVALGYEAFYHCDNLESVSFLGDTPPSSYGDYCFSNCSANLKFHVLEEYYSRYDGQSFLGGNVVAGPPDNEIWYTTNNGETAGYTFRPQYIPPLNAYMGNHGVQFFDGNPPTFDDDYNCFYECANLVSVVLPPSITSIGKSAFERCTNLVSVSIPNTVTNIGQCAFYACESLQTITIPDGVNSIPTLAFESCSTLRSVTILGTISSIETAAFRHCSRLYDIFYFGDGTPDVNTYDTDASFGNCPATIYVKDTAGHGDWGDRPVRSWRSGRGDGSRENPLEIENYINLYGFALEVSVLGDNDLCGKLTRDIVGNSNVLDANGNLNPGTYKEWLPIGYLISSASSSNNIFFCGEFNGNGHTISGLYHYHYNSGSCVGLFGRTGDGAYIHDLGLVDSYMAGGGINGGICGDLAYGHIDNCYNAATVAWGGGIAGWCREHARISNCHNVGHIFTSGSGIANDVFNNPNVTYSVENCYALEGVSNSAINNNQGTTYNVKVKSAAAFASGEVCWLLNGSKIDTKWRQQLGRDSYPTFFGNLLVVYVIGEYYNEGMCDQSPDHIHHLEIAAYGIIPTTTETGRYGYYKCSYCNNKFMDKHGCIPATPESLIIPKAKDNEIWYTTSDNQKLTPYNQDVFGEAYYDADNVYELGIGHIHFDSNVTSIGNSAFYACASLTSITIPSCVTSIEECAFYNCYQLPSVTIPNSVTSIGKEAFRLSGLTSITIPNSVTSIGECAFMQCQGLPSVTIPSSVTSIGKEAFCYCNMSSVTFKSLPELGDKPFDQCTNLTTKALDLTDSDKPYIGTSLANYPGFTEAHYHGTLEPNQWGTITLPFVPSSHSGIVFFSIDNVDAANGTLTLSIVENIEAGKPYLFRNQTGNAGFTLSASASNVPVNINASEQTVGSFALKGTFQAKELTDPVFYELQGNKFVSTGSLSIDPFRAYLKNNGGSAAGTIVINCGGVLVKITKQDDSTITLYGLKKVEFIKENDVPAVRVTYADDSTATYVNPKKVDFEK